MSLEEQDMTAEVATEMVTSEALPEKKPVSTVTSSTKNASSTVAQEPEDGASGKEELVAVIGAAEEEGAEPVAGFKDAASLKESLRAVVEKLLSKQNLQTDLALVQHMNAQMFVPLAYLAQVQCLTSDVEMIEEALRGSEYLTVADESVKPNIKVERNTIVLRDVPTGTSEAKLQEVFSFDGCPQVKSIRADVANTWFVSMCSEEDAKKTIEALRDVTLEGAPLYARLKSENPMRSLLASHASTPADSTGNVGTARGLDGRGYYGGRVFGNGYMAYPMAMNGNGFHNGYGGPHGGRGYSAMNGRGEPRTFVGGRAYNPNTPQAANGYRGTGSGVNGGRGAQPGSYGYRVREGTSGPSSVAGAAAGSPQQPPLLGQAGAAGRGAGKENGKPQQPQQQQQQPPLNAMLGADGQPMSKKAAKVARRREREAAEAAARQKAGGQGTGAEAVSGSTASDNGHAGGRASKKWDDGKGKADRRKTGEAPHDARGKAGSQRDAAATYGDGSGLSESGPASNGPHGEGATTLEARATGASEGVILTNSITHFPPLPGTPRPSACQSSSAESVAEAGDSGKKKDEGAAAASGLGASSGKLFEEKQYAAALLRDPARVTSPTPGPQTPRGDASTATAAAREMGAGEGEASDRVASSEQRPQPAGPGAREEGSSGSSSSSKRDEAAPTGAAESGARSGGHGSGPEPVVSPAKPMTGPGCSNSSVSVGAETQTEPANGQQHLGANRPVTEPSSWSSEPKREHEQDQHHALGSSPSQSQPCHRDTQPSGSAEAPEAPSKRVLHGSWAAAVMHGPPVPPKASSSVAPVSPPPAPTAPTTSTATAAAPLPKPSGASKDVSSSSSSTSSSQPKPERKDASSASRGPAAKGPRQPRGEGTSSKAHPHPRAGNGNGPSSRRPAHVAHDDTHGPDADNDEEEATSAGGGAEGAVQGGKQALKCAPPSSWGNKPTFVEILRAKQEAAAAAAAAAKGTTVTPVVSPKV